MYSIHLLRTIQAWLIPKKIMEQRIRLDQSHCNTGFVPYILSTCNKQNVRDLKQTSEDLPEVLTLEGVKA